MNTYSEIIRKMVESEMPLGEPYDTIHELAGIETTLKIISEFGGSQITFPMIKHVAIAFIKEKLVEEFNGYNYGELAKKYEVSANFVRKVISKSKASTPRKT